MLLLNCRTEESEIEREGKTAQRAVDIEASAFCSDKRNQLSATPLARKKSFLILTILASSHLPGLRFRKFCHEERIVIFVGQDSA